MIHPYNLYREFEINRLIATYFEINHLLLCVCVCLIRKETVLGNLQVRALSHGHFILIYMR